MLLTLVGWLVGWLVLLIRLHLAPLLLVTLSFGNHFLPPSSSSFSLDRIIVAVPSNFLFYIDHLFISGTTFSYVMCYNSCCSYDCSNVWRPIVFTCLDCFAYKPVNTQKIHGIEYFANRCEFF